MGAAAIRHLKTMVMCGYEARDALATAVGSIALDCLRSVMPAEEYEGRQSYLVARVSCVLNALDGEGWSLLTDREADVALFLSHHKAMGIANWGKSEKTLELVHEAIRRGQKITIDQYPYTASQSALMNSIPPEYFTEGKKAFAARLRDPALREELKRRMT